MSSSVSNPLRPAWFFNLGLIATVATWLLYYIGGIPGQTFDATRFILFDQGSFLYAIDRVFAGEQLYRDFAWQYGPLAFGWYGGFALLAGNTPLVLVLAAGIATGAAWIGLVRLAARKVGPLIAWAGGVLGLLPAITAPCLLFMNFGPHGAVEAMLLTGIAWLLAGDRLDRRRSCGLGLAIGVLQLIRFGPHLVAGLLAGILWVARGWPTWPESQRARNTIQTLALMLAGYAMAVLPFAGWLWSRLPAVAVYEQLWPSYMTQHYRETYASRWPAIESAGDFATRWLPLLLGVGLALLALGRRRRHRIRLDGPTAALLFLPLYFLVGCVALFRSAPAVLAHCWMAWPAFALLADWRAKWWRGLVVAALLPACLLNLQGWYSAWRIEQAQRAEPLRLPNGQRLWFHGSETTRFGELARVLEKSRPADAARRLVVLGAGGGIHYFYATARVGRHWWYLNQFVRPWEMSRVAGEIGRHELLLQVVFLPDNAPHQSPASVGLDLPLDPMLARPLLDRLDFVEWIPGVGYLFRFTPPRNPAAAATTR